MDSKVPVKPVYPDSKGKSYSQFNKDLIQNGLKPVSYKEYLDIVNFQTAHLMEQERLLCKPHSVKNVLIRVGIAVGVSILSALFGLDISF